MSPRRLAFLRYERRDDDVRVESDITDSELRLLVLGLWMRLPLDVRQDLATLAAMDAPPLPDLAHQIGAGMGSPHVVDMRRRRIEEEVAE